MKNKGSFLVFIVLLMTFNLFALSKFETGRQIEWSFLTMSQLISLVGTVWLCITYILSAKFNFLEYLFGGLDKVYKLHHISGALSLVLLLHHPLFLAVNVLPRLDLATKYFWFSNSLPYNYGVIALFIMLILLFFTFIINMPYDMWLKTHEWMGFSLFFAALHIVTISSDVSRYMPLRYWMIFWLVMGIFCVIYIRFLYRLIGPKYKYVLEKIQYSSDVIDIFMKPINRPMKYHAGQFGFFEFDSISKESHPYSMASDGDDGKIRIAVKVLGDYTLKMRRLKEGDIATVWGPYGRFFESLSSKKDLVWVAGGIGVTPFLGMIDLAKKLGKRNIDFVYCAKNNTELTFEKEIIEKTLGQEIVNFVGHCTNEKGRINANILLSISKGFDNKKFMFCGPVEMMEDLTKQLVSLGVKRKNIIFEDFNFK